MKEENKIRNKYLLLTAMAMVAMVASVHSGTKVDRDSTVKIVNKETMEADAKAFASRPPSATISDITVKSSVNDEVTKATFPYHRPGIDEEKLDFNFTVKYEKGETTLFKLLPDDCVESIDINGKAVTLTGDTVTQRCNWQSGFEMELKPYLKFGENKVHILVRNAIGWVGLDIQPSDK